MSLSVPQPQPDGGTAVGLIAQIGHTPLIHVGSVEREFDHVSILGKAEWYNPGGSVKDRAALRMIVEAELTGRLFAGKTILDATSGNTGIAYAWIGAAKGYPVHLVLPNNVGPERKRLLAAHGAKMTFTDPLAGMDGAIDHARRLFEEHPERYFYPDQYSNAANWKAHYDGTAVEIWEQTSGRITHFVAGLGTSGTFMGCTRRLKALAPGVTCVSVQPDNAFHGIEGLKFMDAVCKPRIYDSRLADDNVFIKTEDAYTMARRLVREDGLFVGVSAAAVVAACRELAGRIPPGEGACIVGILGDSGEKYLSHEFWTEEDA